MEIVQLGFESFWIYNWPNYSHERCNLTETECVFDSDCARLQLKLKCHWPKAKVKAVVLFLAHKTARAVTFLGNLDKNFNEKFDYPVIVFHEKQNSTWKKLLRNSTKSALYFHEVSFATPPEYRNMTSPRCPSSLGYREMCRFFSKTIYETPILQNVEFYWRLDEDSQLLCPVQFDVFEVMKVKVNVVSYAAYFCSITGW